jgi:hypothetical protein
LRELTVAYRPDQREVTDSAALRSRVAATFRLKQKVVHNGGSPSSRGGSPDPDACGVLVVVQVKRGKGRPVFRQVRTHADGRYTLRYRFTQTMTATSYTMRAQVRKQSAYPGEEGIEEPDDGASSAPSIESDSPASASVSRSASRTRASTRDVDHGVPTLRLSPQPTLAPTVGL